MADIRRVTPAGLALLERFEGFRSKPYLDTAGKPTIGIGHLIHKGETFPDGGITHAEALALMSADLGPCELALFSHVKVPLTDHQFAALASWVYNEGPGALATSTLLHELNAGRIDDVPLLLLAWNKRIDPGTGKLVVDPGLVMRRKAEGAWFATPDDASPMDHPDVVAHVAAVLFSAPETAQILATVAASLRDLAGEAIDDARDTVPATATPAETDIPPTTNEEPSS